MIYVFNKADKCGMGKFAMVQGEDKIFMSAKSMDGIDTLLTLIEASWQEDIAIVVADSLTHGEILCHISMIMQWYIS